MSDHFVKANVVKVQADLGLVFGFAIVSKVDGKDYYDTQGDHIPESSVLKASMKFMTGDRISKEMHAGNSVGQVIFCFPLTSDIAKALDITTPQTGLLIGVKIDDDDVLKKYRDGTYTGFSIGGRRVIDQETIVEEKA